MDNYFKVDEVTPALQYVTGGKGGWSFTLWSKQLDDEAPHRQLLERFATANPDAGIVLPEYFEYEDYVECYAQWSSASVWIYYETIISFLSFWSEDRTAIIELRAALLPFVD